MKYLSEKTNKTYATIEELEKDEKKFDLEQKEKEKAVSKKKEDAKKVQDAYQNLLDVMKKYYEDIRKAEQTYYELRNQFINNYGCWHMTYTNNNGEENISTDVDDILADTIRAYFGW